ncbi:hypothetical protein HanXRQr2_Chr14g0621671 [Helianthus annuus]|uniref:Uncharacterized protein n=1 Tax=Helianthus annuus TaxID=4232 RepID=A0A251SDH3_HELAN|nr:hypothetical protein HanXRQr2_Chr14g0621671 [Helianthus annuus]KAJ0462811.1 hypothetical protein HanHA300_Chr14g0508241 [Helianthus annuus]KAJ0484147.1 hypothetical protein HanHA89_Chr14g0540911 [Helianthus annuus]KAJ0658455.1 hypothetical protein HanOQP8_Chr14g0508451 [Helianthus annuus]
MIDCYSAFSIFFKPIKNLNHKPYSPTFPCFRFNHQLVSIFLRDPKCYKNRTIHLHFSTHNSVRTYPSHLSPQHSRTTRTLSGERYTSPTTPQTCFDTFHTLPDFHFVST